MGWAAAPPRSSRGCCWEPPRVAAHPDADELLSLAATLEGHADNVAAALYGGITLAVEGAMGATPVLRRFRVPEAWIPVAFIAANSSHTSVMRSALPDSVPHHEAAAAAARAALLATAVITSDAGCCAPPWTTGCTSRIACRCCPAPRS